MIKLIDVRKYFNRHKANEIRAIDGTSVELPDRGLVTFLGESGCGKTTLLNAIGGLDKVDSGDIYIGDQRMTRRTSGAKDSLRNLKIGYIFQNYNLIEDMTVYGNVALPLRMLGFRSRRAIEERVMYVLERVGIDRYRNRPARMLSGGERQRVGIARAIVKDPEIIIADEPTGNLDSTNTIEIMNIIKAISRSKLVILVTHERNIAEFYADRIIEIRDGRITGDRLNDHEGSLDYRMDNRIYIQDLPNRAKFSVAGSGFELYSDRAELPGPIRVVIRNNNIYVDTEGALAPGADGVEIINDHYRELSKDVYEKYSFDYSEVFRGTGVGADTGGSARRHAGGLPAGPHYSSIFTPWRSLAQGFRRVHRYSRLKKLLLVGFMLASAFVMYAVSNAAGVVHVTDDDFLTTNRNFLTVSTGPLNTGKYNEAASTEGVLYAIPGNAQVTFSMPFDDYWQLAGCSLDLAGTLSATSDISEANLVAGRMPEDPYEIVIDESIYKSSLGDSFGPLLGYRDAAAYIGRTVRLPYLPDFTIVGTVHMLSPCIYADKSMLLPIAGAGAGLGEQPFDATSPDLVIPEGMVMPLSYFERDAEISLVRGELPDADHEVLISDRYQDEIAIGETVDREIEGTRLTVTGYYHDRRGGSGYYVTDSMDAADMLSGMDNMTVRPQNKAAARDALEKRYSVTDEYSVSRERYIAGIRPGVLRTVAVAAVMVAISLIEIYLILRASFLSRVKEVGVLRAIGLKKGDVYRMFSGEIVAITLLTSLPAMAITAYMISTITAEFPGLSATYRVTPLICLASFAIVFVFNMLAGLLPVFRTLRQTPAAILARNDVN